MTGKFLKRGAKPVVATASHKVATASHKAKPKSKAVPKQAAAKKEARPKATAKKTKAPKATASEQNPWALPAAKVAERKPEKGKNYDQAIAKLKEILEGI